MQGTSTARLCLVSAALPPRRASVTCRAAGSPTAHLFPLPALAMLNVVIQCNPSTCSPSKVSPNGPLSLLLCICKPGSMGRASSLPRVLHHISR